MAESLDDDRGESYNDTSCVTPSKYAVPRISLPQPHNHESDSHSHEPQSHVDQRKYRHLADSTPLLGTPGTAKKFPQRNYCSVLLAIPPDTASNPGMSANQVGSSTNFGGNPFTRRYSPGPSIYTSDSASTIRATSNHLRPGSGSSTISSHPAMRTWGMRVPSSRTRGTR